MSNPFLSQDEIQALIQKLKVDETEGDAPVDAPEEPAHTAEDEWEEDCGQGMAKTRKVVFHPLEPIAVVRKDSRLEELNHVELDMQVVLGEAVLTVGELLQLKEDSLIILDRQTGENARLYANGNYLADGEIVVLNDLFAFRIHFPGDGKREPVDKPPEEEVAEQ